MVAHTGDVPPDCMVDILPTMFVFGARDAFQMGPPQRGSATVRKPTQ